MNTTGIGEKELLEIETLKANMAKTFHDTQMDMKRFDETRSKNLHDIQVDMKRFDEQRSKNLHDVQVNMTRIDIELSKKGYEAWRVAMYGIAVGLGGTFAIAKTISLLGWVG